MHNTASWQKLAPHIYDAGGKIVIVRQSFITSRNAIYIGALLVFASFAAVGIVSSAGKELWVGIAIGSAELLLGAWLLKNGIEGKNIRNESGGIHPKDILYFLDQQRDEVRRQVGAVEAHVAKLSETRFSIEIDRGEKKTEYGINMYLPNNTKIELFESPDKTVTENLLNQITMRLGLAATTPT